MTAVATTTRFRDWDDLRRRMFDPNDTEARRAFVLAAAAGWGVHPEPDEWKSYWGHVRQEIAERGYDLVKEYGDTLSKESAWAAARAELVDHLNLRLAGLAEDAQPDPENTMPTATKKRPAVKAKAAKPKAGRGVPTTQLAASIKAALAEGGGTVVVPTRFVQPFRHNPRQTFDGDKLLELADSIQRLGQKQEAIAWVPDDLPDGKLLELVGGERRYRACELAQQDLRVRVEPLTEAEAVEVAGVENLDREDLTPIEEAAWLQAMIDAGGYSQRKLAARIGIKQPTIALKLGLLKLPDSLQQLVIAGVITQEKCRPLTKYAEGGSNHIAGLLDDVAALLKREDWRTDSDDPSEWILAVADGNGWVSLDSKYSVRADNRWFYKNDMPTETAIAKHSAGLDIVNIEGERFAKNQTVWVRLAESRIAAREKRSGQSSPAKSTNEKPLTPAQQANADKAKAARQRQILRDRLQLHADHWWRQQIATRLTEASTPDEQRVANAAAMHGLMWALRRETRSVSDAIRSVSTDGRDDAASAIVGWIRRGTDNGHDRAGQYAGDAVRELVAEVVVMEKSERNWSPLNLAEVATLARDLSIDWADWSPDEEFLGLFTVGQLVDLVDEWKLTEEPVYPRNAAGEQLGMRVLGGLKKKADLIDGLMQIHRDRENVGGHGLPAPAVLKQAAAKPAG